MYTIYDLLDALNDLADNGYGLDGVAFEVEEGHYFAPDKNMSVVPFMNKPKSPSNRWPRGKERRTYIVENTFDDEIF